MYTSGCGNFHVYWSGAVQKASTVTVAGSGSCMTSVTATSVTSAINFPKHVLSAVYAYGPSWGVPTSVPISTIAQWVNWVGMPGLSYVSAFHSYNIKVYQYMDFWKNYTSDSPIDSYNDLAPGGLHEQAEAVDCSGNPIKISAYGGGYASDPRNVGALGHAQFVLGEVVKRFPGYDAYFEDDTMTPPHPLPCNYSDSAYLSATNSINTALGYRLLPNALSAGGDKKISVVDPSNVIGAMCEACFIDPWGPNNTDEAIHGSYWAAMENAEIGIINKHKLFYLYGRANGDPAAELAIRKYFVASYLLTFDPAYVLVQTSWYSPTYRFPVMPEMSLVPLQPRMTATSVSGYYKSGLYVREYAACGYKGVSVGPCAAIVNPTGATVTIPPLTLHYGHVLTLSGRDVLNGGTLTTTGYPISSLGPYSGTILFQ